jgi:ribosomal protein S20
MHVNRLYSVLLVTALLGGGVGTTLAADAKAADPKVVEVQKMIDGAEKARKKAASVDSEWRDTGKFIKQAQAALKAGDYDKAMKLARKAEDEGNLGYQQGVSQQELHLPSYLKY